MSIFRSIFSKPNSQVLAILLVGIGGYFFLARPVEYAQDIFVMGDRAYLATGVGGLRILDVSTPENPIDIGHLDTPGEVKAVQVQGNLAYLACGRAGLVIADISNPNDIKIIGAYNTPGFAQDIVVADKRVFISDGRAGITELSVNDLNNIQVIKEAHMDVRPGKMRLVGNKIYFVHNRTGIQAADISDPRKPSLSKAVSVNTPIHDIDVQGSFVFLATERGLVVFDYSDAEKPREVINFEVAGGLTDIFIQGQTGYALNRTSFRLLDFSHPPKIHELGMKAIPGDANAIFVKDNLAYIANGYNGLVIHGTRVLVSPDISTVNYSENQITTEGVTKVGNNLFVAAAEQGVRILDVSDPTNPSLVKSIETPGYTHQVTVVADRAFVSDGPAGMLTLDISNLSNAYAPESNLNIGEDSYASVFENDLLYLADGRAGLKIVSFPTPLYPMVIGQVPIPGLVLDVAIRNDTVYAAAGTGGLWTVNVANPIFPDLLGHFGLPQGEAKGLSILEVSENPSGSDTDQDQENTEGERKRIYAFVAYGTSGLYIVDVTNALSPQVVGEYAPGGSIENVWVEHDRAYLANSNGFVHLLDVSELNQPREIGLFRTPSQAKGLTLDNQTLYIADDERGVRILSTANEDNPKEIGFFDAPAYVSYVTASPRGDQVFIMDGRQGLWGVELSGQNEIVTTGSYTTSGIGNSATIADHYLYVADGPAGVKILNINNPHSPQLVGKFDTPGEAMAVFLDGYKLFVADGPKGIRIFNQSDLSAVKEISSLQTPGTARRLALQDDYVYLASLDGGLVILKVDDLSRPARVSVFDALRDVRDVWIKGNYVFLAAGMDGFRVLDISHPLQPVEIYRNFAATPAEDILVLDQYAFVASGKQGVRIFDISDPQQPAEAGLFTQTANALGISVVWQDEVSTQGRSGHYRLMVADAENRLVMLEANKSMLITRSGAYQTPGTANLAQVGKYFLGGFTNHSDPAMEKAARSIRGVLFDMLILGLLGFFVWSGIFSQYVLPIRGGKDRLQIFKRLILFMLGKHGMAIQVKEGKSIQHPGEDNRMGAGVILIDSCSAAIIERRILPYGMLTHLILRFYHYINRTISRLIGKPVNDELAPHFRVVGPGLTFTSAEDFPKLPKWDEKLHGVADLRPQIRMRDEVQGYTREGIELNTSISVIFTLGQNPDVLWVTYEGEQTPENLRVIELEIKGLDFDENVGSRPRVAPVVKGLRDTLDLDDKREIHYTLHGSGARPEHRSSEIPPTDPATPFVFNQERIFDALISRAHDVEDDDFMDWTELPGEVATELFRNLLAGYFYDDLYKPKEPVNMLLPELRARLQTSMRNLGVLGYRYVHRRDGKDIQVGQIWDEAVLKTYPNRIFRTPKILRRRGIKILSAGFTELKPDHALVREKLFDYWSSRWQQNAEVLSADYSLEAIKIRDQAKIESQKEMASLLAGILADAPEEALAMRVFQALEQAAADPANRQFLPMDTISMLRNLYNAYLPWSPPLVGNVPPTSSEPTD